MQANINASKATIAANEANVQRFRDLQGFKKIFAPFSGIITARNVEVGSLINAGSGSSASSSTGATPSGSTMARSGTTPLRTGAPPTSAGPVQHTRTAT